MAGTQAESGRQNFVILMKMCDLRTPYPCGDEGEGEHVYVATLNTYIIMHVVAGEEEEEEEEEEPHLETVMIQHTGAVNRLRVCVSQSPTHACEKCAEEPGNKACSCCTSYALHWVCVLLIIPLSLQVAEGIQKQFVATWSESGSVHVWDASQRMILLDSPRVGVGTPGAQLRGHQDSPLFSYTGHKVLLQCMIQVKFYLFFVLCRLRAMGWPGPPQYLVDWPQETATATYTYGNPERRECGKLAPMHLWATLSLWRISSGAPMRPA